MTDGERAATPLDRKGLKVGDLIEHGRIVNVFRIKDIHDDGAIDVETVISVNDQRDGHWRRADSCAPFPGARVHLNGNRVLVLNESPMWSLPAMEVARGVGSEPFGVTIRTLDEEFMILRRISDVARIHEYERMHDMPLTILGEPGDVTGIYPMELMEEISCMLGTHQEGATALEAWCIWKTREGMPRDTEDMKP
jgi:hypothetical protein